MANISDLIEEFLFNTLGGDEQLNINRNELAHYFSVAPSQINYVLSTRFTPARGYVIESRRGGGGFITIVRVSAEHEDIMSELVADAADSGISMIKAGQIIDRLMAEDCVTAREARILKATVSDRALVAPAVMKDKLRASILTAALGEITKTGEKKEKAAVAPEQEAAKEQEKKNDDV